VGQFENINEGEKAPGLGGLRSNGAFESLPSEEQYWVVKGFGERFEGLTRKLSILRPLVPPERLDEIFVLFERVFYHDIKHFFPDRPLAFRTDTPFVMDDFLEGLDELESAMRALYREFGGGG